MSVVFFVKQKTAYEMRMSDWSSDVCSSDLGVLHRDHGPDVQRLAVRALRPVQELRPCAVPARVTVPCQSGKTGPCGGAWAPSGPRTTTKIGRAPSRQTACQYVESSVAAVTLKKKKHKYNDNTNKHPI